MSFKEHFSWLKYNAKEHRYSDEQGTEFIPVTRLVDSFQTDVFDDAKIEAIAKDRGVEASFLKTKWEIERDFSCVRGTEFHFFVENYIKEGLEIETITPIIHEIELFKEFWRTKKKEIEVIDQELRIASKEFRVSGTVDFLGRDRKTGEYIILDWKTNKNIRFKGFNDSKMLAPFNEAPSCEFSKYSIQLGLYRCVLEKELGLKFKETMIVHFHPQKVAAHPIICKDYSKEIEQVMNSRKIIDGKLF